VWAIERIERHLERDKEKLQVADDLEALLKNNPPEEEIHSFIEDYPFLLGHDNGSVINDRVAEGLLKKFAIAPDRIPDFIFLSIALQHTQHPNRIDVFELKRPDSQLFSTHNRLSKDLNDAWMEAVEAQRLIGLNYTDFLRRAIKEVINNHKNKSVWDQRHIAQGNGYDRDRPRCSFRILIGRRASLSSEEMMRVRELGFSTNFNITISTYDSLLDDLRGRDRGETSRWRW